MEQDNNLIQFYGIKPTKALLGFVKKKVEKWIAREQSLLFLPKVSNYSVNIERDVDSRDPFYSCHIRVTIGTRVFESRHSAEAAQEAVLQALRSMRSNLAFA